MQKRTATAVPVVKVINLGTKTTGSPGKATYKLNNYLTDSEIKAFSDLKYSNGVVMFDIEKRIGNELMYELVYRIQLLKNAGIPNAFDHTIEYIRSRQWDNEDEIYFELPEYEASKYKFTKFIESYHDAREVAASVFKCGKCGSKETIIMSKQTRSGDEGETAKVFCTQCPNSWKLGS